MLAWIMNMGFAASARSAPAVSVAYSERLGLSLYKLGGMVFLLLLTLMPIR